MSIQPSTEAVCAPVLKVRQGSSWTNDLGESFPAISLYAFDCACGQRGHRNLTYMADKAKAAASYARRTGLMVREEVV